MRKLFALLLTIMLLAAVLPVLAAGFTEEDVAGVWMSYVDNPATAGSVMVRVEYFGLDGTNVSMSYGNIGDWRFITADTDNSDNVEPDTWKLNGNRIDLYDAGKDKASWYYELLDHDTMVYYDSTWAITYKRVEKLPNGQVHR